MIVFVSAAAMRTSGALSIYRQFLSYLPEYTVGNSYYLFVDPTMDQPQIPGVVYIPLSKHSWVQRIYWDNHGLQVWSRKNRIHPDLVLSLQNTSIRCNAPQIIYYHQLLPLVDKKWNIWDKKERLLFLYQKFYGYFVSKNFRTDTKIVVQSQYIARLFHRKFKVSMDLITVCEPDMVNIDPETVTPYEYNTDYYHFLYPAASQSYKNHIELIEALYLLKNSEPEVVHRIRLHFTLQRQTDKRLIQTIEKLGLNEQIVFDGVLPYEKLLSMYKSAQGLLFPSYLETVGLPLIEAAAFGIPILVANELYAHDVIQKYEGAQFLPVHSPNTWAEAIFNLCISQERYRPYLNRTRLNDWHTFFTLIHK